MDFDVLVRLISENPLGKHTNLFARVHDVERSINDARLLLGKVEVNRMVFHSQALFEVKCDQENLARLEKITNEEALLKIANAISMTDPDAVLVNTGSDADVRKVREMSLEKGEEAPLAMKDHTIHFDLAQEQARIIDRTFYIVNEGEKTSVLAKKISRDEAFEYIKDHMSGIGRGKVPRFLSAARSL